MPGVGHVSRVFLVLGVTHLTGAVEREPDLLEQLVASGKHHVLGARCVRVDRAGPRRTE